MDVLGGCQMFVQDDPRRPQVISQGTYNVDSATQACLTQRRVVT